MQLTRVAVTGVQHADLAKILLTVHDPRLPRFGPSQKLAAKSIEVCMVICSCLSAYK